MQSVMVVVAQPGEHAVAGVGAGGPDGGADFSFEGGEETLGTGPDPPDRRPDLVFSEGGAELAGRVAQGATPTAAIPKPRVMLAFPIWSSVALPSPLCDGTVVCIVRGSATRRGR